MGLFNRKKAKGVETLPDMPDIPTEVPSTGVEIPTLDSPPIPNSLDATSSEPEVSDLEIPKPNFDINADVPVPSNDFSVPSEDPVQKSTVPDLSNLSLDDLEEDLNLDDIQLSDDSKFDTPVTSSTTEEPVTNEIPSFDEVSKDINKQMQTKPPKGPLFVKIDVFRQAGNVTKEAKELLDATIESNNAFYSTESVKITDMINRIQTAVQHAKKKLYIIDDIIFNR